MTDPTTNPATTTEPTPADSGDPTTSHEEECNVPGCDGSATTRGLCDAHWATHRGFATPRE
ncbi:hypothetical protein AB0N38_10560 [Micromonospora aurantiaca]|uniref:hypothetical protein n=1 Tax=Micromonospora aurantiaca (nom. illeg.) TaxID=47850 RepID=UPI003423B370